MHRTTPSVVPFPDRSAFSFIAPLEASWSEIHDEFKAIENELVDYVETHLYDRGWQVFGLWNLPHREALVDSTMRCPRTAALVERWVPGHGAVAFSVLHPGTSISPHCGRPGPYLRGHLALEVPAGDCRIRVARQTMPWEVGRVLVIDDRLEHEAWNRTGMRRVVLLFDFIV